MTIDKELLEKAVDITMSTSGGRGITISSKNAARVLRYFKNTTPEFHKGTVAADVLSGVVEAEYPDIWSAVCGRISPSGGYVVKCPICEGLYTIGRVWGNKKQTMPVIDDIDSNVLDAVELEIGMKSGQLISVYNSRVSAVMRYLSLAEPNFSISKTAGGLLERGLSGLYPGLF